MGPGTYFGAHECLRLLFEQDTGIILINVIVRGSIIVLTFLGVSKDTILEQRLVGGAYLRPRYRFTMRNVDSGGSYTLRFGTNEVVLVIFLGDTLSVYPSRFIVSPCCINLKMYSPQHFFSPLVKS